MSANGQIKSIMTTSLKKAPGGDAPGLSLCGFL